ncbi:MAG: sensor histidine kinase [Flavobacteriales bacterium]
MKNRITILIVASVAALLALSAIQTHLVLNTYRLTRDAFVDEVDSAISVIDVSGRQDSLFDEWSTEMMDDLTDLQNHRIDKAEVLVRMKSSADSKRPEQKKLYQSLVDSLRLGYDVEYKKLITSVVMYNGNKADTIILLGPADRLVLFGEDFPDADANKIDRMTWFTKHDFISVVGDTISTRSFDLEVVAETMILITDRNSIVFGRVAKLLLASVVIFLFVIGLLFYSIRNLITQKRIAEIKTDFINNITHELKTPLATLSIATRSLRQKPVLDSPTAFTDTLDTIDRQSGRLQKLIDQVLNNSLGAEAIVLNKEPISDTVFFSELIQDFKLSAQHRDVTIHVDLHAPEVILRIDRFHLTTALFNVLENAVKFGIGHVGIRVHTAIKNGEYVIEISDNGIGISDRDQKQIFEKFFRVHEGDVHTVKGLGLGLYLTGQVLKAHGGAITVRSALKEGTTFIIGIPLG